MVNFGKIFVKSSATLSFSIYNDLSQAVKVELTGLDGALSKTYPTSQVVPSAKAAGFDVTLSANNPQTIDRVVVYTINGIHS